MPGEGRATTTVDGNEAASFTLPEAAEIDRLIAYLSRFFTLKIGDCILIEDSHEISLTINSRILACINGKESVNIRVK